MKPRLSLPLGLDLLGAARDAVHETGEPSAPLLAGMKLAAVLTDKALDANGEFAKTFLERIGYEDLVEAGPMD